jgi:hypothetical protein
MTFLQSLSSPVNCPGTRLPEDPEFFSIQKEWKDNQLYRIIENGLKMTGMPACGSA